MEKMNSTKEKVILEKVFEGNARRMIFEKEELSLVKELISNDDDALHVVGDITFASNSKRYVMDIFDELYKNDIKGELLVSFYSECNKDVAELAYNMERGKTNFLRRDTD